MTIHLYCDEDSMDQKLVRALRSRGMEVTTAHEDNMIDREDEEHLDHATLDRSWIPARWIDLCRGVLDGSIGQDRPNSPSRSVFRPFK